MSYVVIYHRCRWQRAKESEQVNKTPVSTTSSTSAYCGNQAASVRMFWASTSSDLNWAKSSRQEFFPSCKVKHCRCFTDNIFLILNSSYTSWNASSCLGAFVILLTRVAVEFLGSILSHYKYAEAQEMIFSLPKLFQNCCYHELLLPLYFILFFLVWQYFPRQGCAWNCSFFLEGGRCFFPGWM